MAGGYSVINLDDRVGLVDCSAIEFGKVFQLRCVEQVIGNGCYLELDSF